MQINITSLFTELHERFPHPGLDQAKPRQPSFRACFPRWRFLPGNQAGFSLSCFFHSKMSQEKPLNHRISDPISQCLQSHRRTLFGKQEQDLGGVETQKAIAVRGTMCDLHFPSETTTTIPTPPVDSKIQRAGRSREKLSWRGRRGPRTNRALENWGSSFACAEFGIFFLQPQFTAGDSQNAPFGHRRIPWRKLSYQTLPHANCSHPFQLDLTPSCSSSA